MKLRPYRYGEDFPLLESWITDGRTHALWCAGRFPRPLERRSFEEKLRGFAEGGVRPLVAVRETGEPVGFLCLSPGPAPGEGRLKFVVIDPGQRGKGYGGEMTALAAEAAGAAGIRTLRLSVFSVNEAARRCYARAGFTEEKTEDNAFTFGGEVWGRRVMALTIKEK